jgi:hypothetical protein
MKPYRKQKNAQPIDNDGVMRCDRCGQRLSYWPLVRSDNCGPFRDAAGIGTCIRTIEAVIASWEKYGHTVNVNFATMPLIIERL